MTGSLAWRARTPRARWPPMRLFPAVAPAAAEVTDSLAHRASKAPGDARQQSHRLTRPSAHAPQHGERAGGRRLAASPDSQWERERACHAVKRGAIIEASYPRAKHELISYIQRKPFCAFPWAPQHPYGRASSEDRIAKLHEIGSEIALQNVPPTNEK